MKMDFNKIIDALKAYFYWLINFLKKFGVEAPEELESAVAPSEDAAE